MKKVMNIVILLIMVSTLNLFGEIGKTEKHICTDECKESCKLAEITKECGPDCTKPCYAEAKKTVKHICNDECKKDCELEKSHNCIDKCKGKDVKKCEPGCTKPCCAEKQEQKCDHKAGEPCTEECKTVNKKEACGSATKKKGCH